MRGGRHWRTAFNYRNVSQKDGSCVIRLRPTNTNSIYQQHDEKTFDLTCGSTKRAVGISEPFIALLRWPCFGVLHVEFYQSRRKPSHHINQAVLYNVYKVYDASETVSLSHSK